MRVLTRAIAIINTTQKDSEQLLACVLTCAIAIINTVSFVVAVAAGIVQAHQRVNSEFISPLEGWSILTCWATWCLGTFIILILRCHRIRVPSPIYVWWFATAIPVLLFSAGVVIFFV